MAATEVARPVSDMTFRLDPYLLCLAGDHHKVKCRREVNPKDQRGRQDEEKDPCTSLRYPLELYLINSFQVFLAEEDEPSLTPFQDEDLTNYGFRNVTNTNIGSPSYPLKTPANFSSSRNAHASSSTLSQLPLATTSCNATGSTNSFSKGVSPLNSPEHSPVSCFFKKNDRYYENVWSSAYKFRSFEL